MASITGNPPPHETSFECTWCKFKGICKPPQKVNAAATRKFFMKKGG